MQKSTKEALDQLEKEEKRKTIRGIAGVICIFLGSCLFLTYYYDPYQTTGEQYEGTITGAYKPETDKIHANTRLLIKLDGGRTVKVIATRAGGYQIGKRVIVEKYVSKRFKKKSFSFVKYIEPPIKYLNESEQKRIIQSLNLSGHP
jgi:hypothetical protein